MTTEQRISSAMASALPTVPATSVASPSRRKGGAPAGNRNALRHGLTTGSDPAPYITRLTSQFRHEVEQAVLAAVGSITVAAASEIQAAAEWENHRIKVRRWLREAAATLTIEQKLSLSREAARAATERTKHLKALCIGSPAKRSLWATLEVQARDAETREPGESPAAADASDGSQANGGATL